MKRLRRIFLAGAAGLTVCAPSFAASGGFQPQGCLALPEAMALAAETDPGVDLGRAQREDALADLAEARSLRRPQLAAFAQSGIGDTGLIDSAIENQAGLQLSQRLIDFGDSRYARRAARAAVEAGDFAIAAARGGAAEETGEVYLGLLETEARLGAVSERAAFFQRQLDALDGAPPGSSTRTERAEVAARLAAAQAAELEARLLAHQFARQLLTLTGASASVCGEDWAEIALAELAEPLRDPASALALATEGNPAIRRLEAEVRSAEAAAERERRNRLPAIELVGIASYTYDQTTDDFDFRDRVGVDVSVPLYAGEALKAQRRRARAEASRIEAQLRDAQRLLTEEVEISLQRIRSLEAQIIRLENAEAQAALQLAAAEEEFDAGVRTLPELVEVRLDFEQAVLDLISVRFAFLRAQLRLGALTGTVLPESDQAVANSRQ